MAYKDYSDARDFYASPEYAKAAHVYGVTWLFFAMCRPPRRIIINNFSAIMEIADKEYTVDKCIEVFRPRTEVSSFGFEAQLFPGRWERLMERRPEYRHLKPLTENDC